MKHHHYEALIVGGGPAGCSCALWLKHLGLKPLLIERSHRLGGLQNDSPYPNIWILGKNYKNGKAFAKDVNQQIKSARIETLFESEISILKYLESEKIFSILIQKKRSLLKVTASFVVLATGVFPRAGGFNPSESVLIGPGDQIEAAHFKGKTVAILGGGDNAFENYQFIKKQRPKSVKIFARNVRAQLPFVQKIKPGDLSVGPYSADSQAMTVNQIPFDFLVVMYGWQAENVLAPWIPLEMANEFLVTDQFRRTSFDRVYAIGEVTQASHPCCVTAMADGIVAAKDIQRRVDAMRVPQEVARKIKT